MNPYKVLSEAINRLLELDAEREVIMKRFPVLREVSATKNGGVRKISAAARKKMSEAAKARWKKKRPKVLGVST